MKQYINGKTVEGKGPLTKIINPATEETASTLSLADNAQAQEALEAAQNAFKKWSALSLSERGMWIEKLAEAVESKTEELTKLLMIESGKPYVVANGEVILLSGILRFYLEEAKAMQDTILREPDSGKYQNMIKRMPLGVVVGHLAWNFPVVNLFYKIGPVLASGSTCVLKPSQKTPLASLYIGKIAEEIGFPAGVINIIAGKSSEVGKILNESKIPQMITMIGSSEVGKSVIRESCTSIKRFSLELGGNAPAIVMEDADIDTAAKDICFVKLLNAGQVCVAPNRIFLHENTHGLFLQIAKFIFEQVQIGWDEDGANFGPLISRESAERMDELVTDAVSKGAKIICGGKRPENKDKGYYYLPTILDNCTPDMRVCREEVFGPVMPIIKFKSKYAVIKEANNTEYGLAAYLYTNTLKDAFEFSDALDFGTVCVNEIHFNIRLPHGGVKESGIGKDCSVYSLEEYYTIKRISIRT